MATAAPPLICPQGHGPGVPGAGFCTACGTRLVPPKPPIQQTAVAPAAGNVPWTPVATAPAAPTAASVPWTPGASAPAAPAMPTSPAPYSGGAVVASAAQAATAAQAAVMGFVKNTPTVCALCGGNGAKLDAAQDVCPGCAWLRPLLPGYKLDRSVFLWAQDGQAMSKLQKITALHSVVKSVSDKVGRPWIESTFNGIRLGPRQLPDVWKQAVLAARILGLPGMPDVYVSGDQQWNTYTFGTDTSSFIVLGTAIVTNFQNDELLFMLAREMGHCAAGHALWKTVSRFLAGDTSVHSGLLSNGVLNAISPSKLLEGAIEMPLMAWSRQSDITADRAGLLAVGEEALARRVLLAWSIRSARLLKQVNIEEWMKQEDASDDNLTRFSEMTTSASMYTTRRLRLLGIAGRDQPLMRWSESVQPVRRKLAPQPQPAPGKPLAIVAGPASVAQVGGTGQAAAAGGAVTPTDSVRAVCNKCQTAVRIPLAVLKGKTSLNVRCPKCQNVFTMRQRPAAPPPVIAGAGQSAAVPAPASTKPASAPPAIAGANPVTPAQGPAGAKPVPSAPVAASAKQVAVKPVVASAKRLPPSPVHASAQK